MGSYSVVKNTPLFIDPVIDFADTGWTISNGIAIHDGPNAGGIKFTLDLSSYPVWFFAFSVKDFTNGSIKLIVDGVESSPITAAGNYTLQFTNSNETAVIEFYSVGKNSVSYLQTYPQITGSNATTIVFNEDENQFVGEHSYQPELYHKFLEDLFSFKDGRLWQHDVNPIKNKFYDVQYTSKIGVVANDLPAIQKRYLGIKIESNQRWGLRNIQILPTESYPNGMKSLLHEKNFTLDKGEYYSAFFRDMLDPQFSNQLQALFEGRELEGKILVLELECVSTENVELRAIYVNSVEKFNDF